MTGDSQSQNCLCPLTLHGPLYPLCRVAEWSCLSVCLLHWSPLVHNRSWYRLQIWRTYVPCIVDASILVIVYITSSLQNPLHTAVIVLEKDNTPFNYPILNSCSLRTVSSTDVCLNLDDCMLYNSPMCSLNFVHIVRIVRLILRLVLCSWFCFITAFNIVTACAWHARLKCYLS